MLVIVGSITTATRLAKLFTEATGRPAQVIHTPASVKSGGCSYSLRFSDKFENTVRSVVREYKVPVKQFYRENGHEYYAVP